MARARRVTRTSQAGVAAGRGRAAEVRAHDKELRAKSVIGGIDQATLSRYELFAVRRDRYDALMMSDDPIRLYSRVIDVIRYPAGDIDMYLVDISPEN